MNDCRVSETVSSNYGHHALQPLPMRSSKHASQSEKLGAPLSNGT